ncbi:Transposon Tf2-9 polyprotein [Grifola frondosa]|uniref:Transposon Tf2-9 polyprotein n=1 Tax=Grifola frondosa TaxID=5627 RepID=A0A1C7M7G8_GRIFR|nr:Transposon Tf2-9 polyprotein [Grifola frondosa]
MPPLDPIHLPSNPQAVYQARRDAFRKAHNTGFLWPAELDLIDDFMCKQHEGFAWDDTERVEIPVIEHKPWVQRNIPIPPGIFDEVCRIIRKKIEAGVYEPSNSSYRSRWFCVLKKDGKALRLVHSLEPLNAVTIQHSGVPPIPEHIAEKFGNRACGGMLDLYVGYDEREIAESSRDLTSFQTPYGALRLVTLPMGWTNAVPIFHDDVTYILQPEIPHITIPYIDDVPVRGPETRYELADGGYEVIATNPGIRRFVWEHMHSISRIVQRMRYCGGTFSGTKSLLVAEETLVIGHRCTYKGRLPEESRVKAIENWGPCKDLSEVRAFLGTIGVVRIFIRNFAQRAHPLVYLTRKDIPFEFGPRQIQAQEDLKQALLESPALRAIDYTSDSPVILAVDTSYIAVGFHLCQCDLENPRIRYYNRFSSITLNDRESRFSQPKLEIYGLFRALRALRLYLIGVRNLVIEVDARYIKGMLQNPDIAPQPDDEDEPEDDFEDWIDRIHGFAHLVNPHPTQKVTRDSLASIYTIDEPHPHSRHSSQVPEGEGESQDPPVDSYDIVPRSIQAIALDQRLLLVRDWHRTLERPTQFTDADYETFVKFAVQFFVDSDRLWKRDPHGAHKLAIEESMRREHLSANDSGGLITLKDIVWFVRTCLICQQRQSRQVLIPPVVAMPAPLFAKVHLDTMHLPPSSGYKYLVQGRDSLTFYPEFRALRAETAKTLGDFIFEDILCRWGAISEIVTDNGTAFVKATEYLAKKYHVHHIRISGYNSRANGIVERSHYDIRGALFKAADGDQKRWSQVVHSVFWAERITVRKRMGCSPYFAATGTHPIIPLDISEATYLQPPPDSIMSTTDLIARRAIALQKRHEQVARLNSKVFEARVAAAVRFEREHKTTIRDFDFKHGDLVLMRHTQIEKSLNRKMRPRYLGPLVVLARNRGGAYILAELDGTVFDRPIAAFRVIPFFARKSIAVPQALLDIDEERLREMREVTSQGDDEEIRDNMEHVEAEDEEDLPQE